MSTHLSALLLLAQCLVMRTQSTEPLPASLVSLRAALLGESASRATTPVAQSRRLAVALSMGHILLLRVGNASATTGFVGQGMNDVFTLHEVDPGSGTFIQNISVDPTFTGLGATFRSGGKAVLLPGSGSLASSTNATFVGWAGLRALPGSVQFAGIGASTTFATSSVKWDGSMQRVVNLSAGGGSLFTCVAGCYPSHSVPALPLLEDTGGAYVSLAPLSSVKPPSPLVFSSGTDNNVGATVAIGYANCTYTAPTILSGPTQLYVWASGSGCAAVGLVATATPVPTSTGPYATLLGKFGGAYGASSNTSSVAPVSWAIAGSPAFPTAQLAIFVADTSPTLSGIWRFFVKADFSGWTGNATPWCTVKNVTAMAAVGTGLYYIIGGAQPFYVDATTSTCVSSPFPYAIPGAGITNTSQSQYVGVSYIAVTCPAGFYCGPNGGQSTCPAGSYCPQSSFWATQCPGGTWSATVSATSIATCAPCTAAPGNYCSAGTTVAAGAPCPPGYSCKGGVAQPIPCACYAGCLTAGMAFEPSPVWNLSTALGSPVAGSTNGPAGVATFRDIYGLVWNGTVSQQGGGQLIVSEGTANLDVRVINAVTGTVFQLAGNGTPGSSNAAPPATKSTFQGPAGLALSSGAGRILFIADAPANQIRALSDNGAKLSTLPVTFTNPWGLAVDASGTRLVVSNRGGHTVNIVNVTATQTASILITCGQSGVSGAIVDGACGPLNRLNAPAGVAIDSAGAVAYVADFGNCAVRTVDLGRYVLSTLTGFNGCGPYADGPMATATFSSPLSLVVDFVGNVYAIESAASRIRFINVFAQTVRTLFSGGATLNTGYMSVAGVYAPQSLAFRKFADNLPYQTDLFLSTNGPAGNFVHVVSCAPCPSGYLCELGSSAPPTVVACPAGNYCPWPRPAGAVPLPCAVGTFSSGAATNCTACPFNTTTLAANATSVDSCYACAPGLYGKQPTCAPCPRGHFCPANTRNGLAQNCGRGNYCPLGSAVPLPCPVSVPPSDGWGEQAVQGPAFVVETASCFSHCFFQQEGGAGTRSSC